MENVAGEQGLALQQLFPYKSSHSFKTSDCHKILFFIDGGLKLGHFDIFDMLSSFLAFVKLIAHNFMKSRSRDGLASKGQLHIFEVSFVLQFPKETWIQIKQHQIMKYIRLEY